MNEGDGKEMSYLSSFSALHHGCMIKLQDRYDIQLLDLQCIMDDHVTKTNMDKARQNQATCTSPSSQQKATVTFSVASQLGLFGPHAETRIIENQDNA